MVFRLKNYVDRVGKVDWELRKFHGDEYSTHRGSAYNSYLVQENQITLVCDSMWNGTQVLAENLRTAGFEVVGDGFKALWNPDDQAMGAALDYGKQIAGGLQ